VNRLSKRTFEKRLEEALIKAEEEGWIEDSTDPWADLRCFGLRDRYEPQFNCEECPLSPLCGELSEDTKNV